MGEDSGIGGVSTPQREDGATVWPVSIIIALALLAIGYLAFSANSQPKAAPSVYGGLYGAIVLNDGQNLLLKKQNGTCVLIEYEKSPVVVDCPIGDLAAP